MTFYNSTTERKVKFTVNGKDSANISLKKDTQITNKHLKMPTDTLSWSPGKHRKATRRYFLTPARMATILTNAK